MMKQNGRSDAACARGAYPGRFRVDLTSAFSLLEIILVLVLIAVGAAILMPSVSAAFATYHLERAAEDVQHRIVRVRLDAMELSVPYAFTYRPEQDQFMSWACDPLDLGGAMSGTAAAAGVSGGDQYDRRTFTLNDRADDREFRFLAATLDESLGAMGLGHEGRSLLLETGSSESLAASSLLSQRKLGQVAPSPRSVAALQIPGLQLGEVAEPIVFEPDGTADRDAIIRIADRTNRYIELTVHGITGSVSVSGVLSGDPLTTAAQPRRGVVRPSRSREVMPGESP